MKPTQANSDDDVNLLSVQVMKEVSFQPNDSNPLLLLKSLIPGSLQDCLKNSWSSESHSLSLIPLSRHLHQC